MIGKKVGYLVRGYPGKRSASKRPDFFGDITLGVKTRQQGCLPEVSAVASTRGYEPHRFTTQESESFARFAEHQRQMRATIGQENLARLIARPQGCCAIFAMDFRNGTNSHVLEHIYQLFGDGVVLLPLPCGTKKLELPSWQSISVEQTRTPAYQDKLHAAEERGGNIAIRFGPGGCFGVDIDELGKVDWFLAHYPPAEKTLRRRGARGKAFFFRLEGGYPRGGAVFNLQDEAGRKFGELRIGGEGRGAYQLLWGLHPDGPRFEFENDAQVLTIDGSDFADLLDVLGLDYRRVFVGEGDDDDRSHEGEQRRRTGDRKLQEEQEPEEYQLRGRSLPDYAESPIDESQNLLGNRYLSRGAGSLIIAPSGHGKSSLTIQQALCFSCGRVSFGIKPAAPWRVLIVQAEDDDNDTIEMAQMIDRLELVPAERALVRANTHCEWLDDKTGAEFLKTLRIILQKWPADLLYLNPLSAYTGCAMDDEIGLRNFLRTGLTPIFKAFRCGGNLIHHNPKTQFQNIDKFSWYDFMYAGAGRAELTNWARAAMVIVPSDTPGTYRFVATKRYEKLGWIERDYWFSHSVVEGKILWVPSSQEQIAGAQAARRGEPEDLLTLIPPLDPILQEQLWHLARKKLGTGEKATRNNVKILLQDQKIYQHSIPRKNTKSAIGYAKSPPVED